MVKVLDWPADNLDEHLKTLKPVAKSDLLTPRQFVATQPAANTRSGKKPKVKIMAIDHLNTNSVTNKGVQKGVNQGANVQRQDRETTAKGVAQPEGRVSISPEANRLHQLEGKIHATPDVDHQRVADIKRAIADGSYSFDVESIASKMLDQDDYFA